MPRPPAVCTGSFQYTTSLFHLSVLLRESLNQPIVMIFEDLQLTDKETQGLARLGRQRSDVKFSARWDSARRGVPPSLMEGLPAEEILTDHLVGCRMQL